MFELMHRHRRAVMIFVLIFAGAPMALFFGVGNPFEGRPAGSDLTQTVIEVYDQPVDAATFLNQYAAITDQLRASGQPIPTAEEMVLNETVDRMIENLINDALLMHEVKDRPYRPDRAYLEERLKEFAIFQDAQGNFSSRYYNQWVTAQQNAGLNWNAIWDMVAEQAKRELYLQMVTASGRVLESELREEFEHNNTQIKVRYMLVEPPIEVTDADIEQYYQEHQAQYMSEPQVTARVVGLSTKAPEPPLVREIIEKARGGADFGQLATEHSKSSTRVEGGSLGWTTKSDSLPTFRQRVFELEPGQVSDPVEGPLGLYIYKVEEKRTDEAAGREEVLAREIVIPARVSPEEQAAVVQRVEELIAAAETSGLTAAAEAAGLQTITVGPLDMTTVELPGIEPVDAARLRMALTQEDAGIGLVKEPIVGTNHIFAAEVVEIKPPQQKTLEQARKEVTEQWIDDHKQQPEYAQKLADFLNEVQAKLSEYKSLDEIAAAHPEMTTEVKSTRFFGRTDMLLDHGWFIDPSRVHAALAGKEPGALAGPIGDFRNENYFVELVERQEPTEEMWEKDWPAERDRLREMAEMSLSNERVSDYLKHQLEKAFAAGQVRSDSDAMFALLGVNPAGSESPVMTPESPIPPAEPQMEPSATPEASAPATEAPAVPVENE